MMILSPFFCQEIVLPFSLKKEEYEIAQDCMGIITTRVERFMIDMVS